MLPLGGYILKSNVNKNVKSIHGLNVVLIDTVDNINNTIKIHIN